VRRRQGIPAGDRRAAGLGPAPSSSRSRSGPPRPAAPPRGWRRHWDSRASGCTGGGTTRSARWSAGHGVTGAKPIAWAGGYRARVAQGFRPADWDAAATLPGGPTVHVYSDGDGEWRPSMRASSVAAQGRCACLPRHCSPRLFRSCINTVGEMRNVAAIPEQT
jgi:hypothetical protein